MGVSFCASENQALNSTVSLFLLSFSLLEPAGRHLLSVGWVLCIAEWTVGWSAGLSCSLWAGSGGQFPFTCGIWSEGAGVVLPVVQGVTAGELQNRTLAVLGPTSLPVWVVTKLNVFSTPGCKRTFSGNSQTFFFACSFLSKGKPSKEKLQVTAWKH